MTVLWTSAAADPPEELLLHRSEPEARAVLEDWHLTVGSRLVLGGPQMRIDGGGGGYGDGGYYPYVLVGWVRRVAGDEYDVVGARCVRRFGESQALAGLAARGPLREREKQPTDLLEPAALPERIHRLLVRRCLPCDEKAWAKDCPRPEGWAAGSAGRP